MRTRERTNQERPAKKRRKKIVGFITPFVPFIGLIILDDCASSQAVKNRTSELVKLGFSARHYSLSTIVITQQLTSISKPYRENISKFVTFYNPSGKDMNTIFDDYLSTLDASEKQIISSLKNNDYARLEVLLRRPYMHEVVSKALRRLLMKSIFLCFA